MSSRPSRHSRGRHHQRDIAITWCFLIRHIAGLIALAMNRRRLQLGAFVQNPARDYLLPALLTASKIAVHFNGRPVIESQHGETVLGEIVVQRPQRREVETVIGAVVPGPREIRGRSPQVRCCPRQHRRAAGANRDRGLDHWRGSPLRGRLAAMCAFAKKLRDGVMERLEEVLVHVAGNPVRFRAGRNVHGVTLIVRNRGLPLRTRVRW